MVGEGDGVIAGFVQHGDHETAQDRVILDDEDGLLRPAGIANKLRHHEK